VGTEFTVETFNAVVRQGQSAREDSYLNAPLYYALTGRKGLWIHEGYGSVMATCMHPHVPGRVLAFPEVGQGAGKLAASVLSCLRAPRGGVQLARYNDHDLQTLRAAFAQKNDSAVETLKLIAEDCLDWKFPVHILDTARVAAMQGGAFEKIRNKVRKVNGVLEIMTLKDTRALRSMRAAQKYWEGSMVMRGRDIGDISGFYDTLFAMIKRRPEQFNGLVFMQGARPVGFTVYDRPFMETANLLANLSDASVCGLADFQVVETCRALAEEGISFMNFGGSEHEGLDQYKRKFMPVKSLGVMSAEVVYIPRNDANVQSGKLEIA
jgi:hypothetical protein